MTEKTSSYRGVIEPFLDLNNIIFPKSLAIFSEISVVIWKTFWESWESSEIGVKNSLRCPEILFGFYQEEKNF